MALRRKGKARFTRTFLLALALVTGRGMSADISNLPHLMQDHLCALGMTGFSHPESVTLMSYVSLHPSHIAQSLETWVEAISEKGTVEAYVSYHSSHQSLHFFVNHLYTRTRFFIEIAFITVPQEHSALVAQGSLTAADLAVLKDNIADFELAYLLEIEQSPNTLVPANAQSDTGFIRSVLNTTFTREEMIRFFGVEPWPEDDLPPGYFALD